MNRKYIMSFSIVVLIILSYSFLWYKLTDNFVKSLKNTAKDNSSYNIIIDTNNISTDGFPFKIGAKINSIIEKTSNESIEHKAPLLLGYDILHQRFYISYNGESNVISSDDSSKNLKIESNHNIFANANLSIKMMETIYKNTSNFEIINFIKVLQSKNHQKIYSSTDNKLLLENDSEITTNYYNSSYYKNSDELINDTNKAKLHVNLSYKTLHSDETIHLPLLHSPISPLLSSRVKNYDCDLDIDFQFKDMLNNFNLAINSANYEGILGSAKASGFIKTSSNEDGSSKTFDIKLNDSENLKEGYINTINELITMTFSNQNIGVVGVPAKSPVIQDIIDNPKKYYLINNDTKNANISIDMSITKDQGNINLNIRDFSILFDNVGFKLASKTELNNNFDMTSNSILIINNYSNIFDYWGSYINQTLNNSYDKERLEFTKTVSTDFLRSASDHPESQNPEMVFSIESDGEVNNTKIGKFNFNDIMALYKSILYKNALEFVKKDPKFLNRANEFIPELINDKAIMDSLNKEALSNNGSTTQGNKKTVDTKNETKQ